MSDSFFNDTLNFIYGVTKAISKMEEKNKKAEKSDKDSGGYEILTAEKLRQMKWMSGSQLNAIFRNGKKRVKIADDSEAYSQLKWFSSEQLQAIFGDNGIEEEEEEEEEDNG